MPNKWIAIAPIDHIYWLNNLTLPISFAQSVTLDVIPSWVKKQETLKHLGTVDADKIRRANYAFQVTYEADAIGSAQEKKEQAIFLANIATWVTKPNGLGFFAMIHLDEIDKEPQLRRHYTSRRCLPHIDYKDTTLNKDDFVKAASFHERLSKLDNKKPVWLAVNALWLGLREHDWASRFIQFWISLEALFGPEDARETSFRISQRIALFLEHDSKKTKELFQKAKKSYSWRSKIVHGLRHAKLKSEESVIQSLFIEQLVASVLSKILEKESLLNIFDGTSREKYLDNLAFEK